MVLRRRDRGAAAVEFALVVPMLLLLVFGIIDFGRMLNVKITLTQAAREGARAAAVGTVGDGKTWARNAAQGLDIGDPNILGCGGGRTSANANLATTFHFITPISVFIGGGGTVTLHSQAVTPCLR